MTQTELDFLLTKLKCCASSLAIEIAESLVIGGCDNTTKLFMLLNYIKEIAKYNLTNINNNCLSTTQFDNIVQNAKDICHYCDCGNNSINT